MHPIHTNIPETQKKVKPQERPEIERNNKLLRFWKTGNYSKASLGRMFKLTRERVRKIIVTHGQEKGENK